MSLTAEQLIQILRSGHAIFQVLTNDLGCDDLSYSAHRWRPHNYTKTYSAPPFAMRRLEPYCPRRRLCLLSTDTTWLAHMGYYVAGTHAASE